MKGGSPIAPEEIRAASTLQRRSGWRTISKGDTRFRGFVVIGPALFLASLSPSNPRCISSETDDCRIAFERSQQKRACLLAFCLACPSCRDGTCTVVQTMMQLGLLPANILLPVADAPVIGMVRSCLAADTSLIAEGIPKAPRKLLAVACVCVCMFPI